MNKYPTIIVFNQQFTRSQYVTPDAFRYNPSAGWRWVQKFCFWALKKIGCFASEIRTTVTEIEINQIDKLRDSVLEQRRRMMCRGEEPDFILTGFDELAKIRKEDIENVRTKFFEISSTTESRSDRLYGLSIRAVPYFRGIVVVPKAR